MNELAEEQATGPLWRRALWVILGIPLGLLALCLMLLYADAYLRDWLALAARYPAPGPPSVPVEMEQRGAFGRFGLARIPAVMQAAATPEGFYVAMPQWLRIGHRPLLIPWEQLTVVDCARVGNQDPLLEMRTRDEVRASIFLHKGVAQKVADKLPPLCPEGV